MNSVYAREFGVTALGERKQMVVMDRNANIRIFIMEEEEEVVPLYQRHGFPINIEAKLLYQCCYISPSKLEIAAKCYELSF